MYKVFLLIRILFQFLSTGNDFATRHQCCTLWIVNPDETQDVLIELTALLEAKRPERSIEFKSLTSQDSSKTM